MAAILDFTKNSSLSEKMRKLQIIVAREVKFETVSHFLLLVAFLYVFSKKGGKRALLLKNGLPTSCCL